MDSRWSSVRPKARGRSWVVLLPLWMSAVAGAATPARAQTAWEAGLQAVGTIAQRSMVVAGPLVAVRPSSRVRVSLGAAAGASEGEFAWRGELLGHFLLSPSKRRGVGLYGAGGIAGVAGPVDRGYLVLTLGVEARPAARSGWTVEAGIGGGARLAVGYRLRWMRRGP